MLIHSDLLPQILFLDIETVSGEKEFDAIEERLKPLWARKTEQLTGGLEVKPEDYYFERAGIYAEFGRIICIAVGFFQKEGSGFKFRAKCFSGHDESQVLKDFAMLLQANSQKSSRFSWLCAHNGKEFDYPYMCRRFLINGLDIPALLAEMSTKKPWEVHHLDTLDFWKFGDRKNYTSLELLATLFKIPTSKDGIDGSMVNQAYYHENNLEKIAEYCKRDVLVLARLFQKLNGKDFIPDQDVIWV